MKVCAVCNEIVAAGQGCSRLDCPNQEVQVSSDLAPKIEPGSTGRADRATQSGLDGVGGAARGTTRRATFIAIAMLSLTLAVIFTPWSKIYLRIFEFELYKVEVIGVSEDQDVLEVYNLTIRYMGKSPDLDVLEQEIKKLTWVENVSLAVTPPDKLIISIDELENMIASSLPPFSGEGSEQNLNSLREVLAVSGHLRGNIKSAEWIGNRRWNITFDTGQVLALPEKEPVTAMIKITRLDGKNHLIGRRDIIALDMRTPPRVYINTQPGTMAASDSPR